MSGTFGPYIANGNHRGQNNQGGNFTYYRGRGESTSSFNNRGGRGSYRGRYEGFPTNDSYRDPYHRAHTPKKTPFDEMDEVPYTMNNSGGGYSYNDQSGGRRGSSRTPRQQHTQNSSYSGHSSQNQNLATSYVQPRPPNISQNSDHNTNTQHSHYTPNHQRHHQHPKSEPNNSDYNSRNDQNYRGSNREHQHTNYRRDPSPWKPNQRGEAVHHFNGAAGVTIGTDKLKSYKDEITESTSPFSNNPFDDNWKAPTALDVKSPSYYPPQQATSHKRQSIQVQPDLSLEGGNAARIPSTSNNFTPIREDTKKVNPEETYDQDRIILDNCKQRVELKSMAVTFAKSQGRRYLDKLDADPGQHAHLEDDRIKIENMYEDRIRELNLQEADDEEDFEQRASHMVTFTMIKRKNLKESFEVFDRLNKGRFRAELFRVLNLLQFEAQLPIYAKKEEFIKSYADSQVIIFKSNAGSGKSTQMPQYLLECVKGRVLVTQPRAIASQSVSNRVQDVVYRLTTGNVQSWLQQEAGRLHLWSEVQDRSCVYRSRLHH